MNVLRALLSGRKTYIVAGLMIGYQVLGYLIEGRPIDWNFVLEAGGLTTLRAAIAKG